MLIEGSPRAAGAAKTAPRPRVLLVTGMSGAGRSTALKTLEDIGYEACDNLPLSLVPALIESVADAQAIAVGVDTRTRGFASETMLETLDIVRGTAQQPKVLFVD